MRLLAVESYAKQPKSSIRRGRRSSRAVSNNGVSRLRQIGQFRPPTARSTIVLPQCRSELKPCDKISVHLEGT